MRIARVLATVVLFGALPAFQGGDRPEVDPPSRVGRLSYLGGSVSFRPGDADDWAAATVNYPLHGGDHLWTDADARAEITLGSTALRLAPYTAFGFLALDDHTTQVRLSQGSLSVRLRNLDDEDSFEIDTPNGAVSLLRPGSYRVDVDSTGDTATVTVRRGEAEITAAGSAFTVKRDQAAVVSGTDSPSYDIRDALPPNDWEEWCASRDRRWDDSRSARYVSRETIGYEDLDEHGDWRDTPDYGPVWVPHPVMAGWAPYRYGHWAWVEPWGWTWIDDASWGFAPFHYGRWVYWDGSWVWVPGHVVARPVYAPALVVFVGGRNWSLAITSGGVAGVAWFPLAPEEPYVPAYHVSNTYIRNVNVTNVNVTNINVTNINVTNINYRNRAAPGAVTVVSQQTFVQSRPVGRSVLVVPRERIEQATVIGTTAAVAPGRRSVLAQPEIVTVRRPPAVVTTRTVVVRRTPPPPPVPFAARQQALRAQPGRPLDAAALASLRARTPAARPNVFVRPAVPAAAGAGPAPTLRPAREGVPPARAVPPPTVAAPQLEKRPPAVPAANRPAADRTAPPAAAPEQHPGRAERPKPATPPTPPTPPAERPERPGRAEHPAPTVAPAERPGRAEHPAPAARAAERPVKAERPAPAATPAPAPTPAPAARPEPAERLQPQGERRPPPAAKQRPEKDRKAEKDTAKEKKPKEDKPKEDKPDRHE